VAKKFGEDRASNLAVLVAYYAFVSLFPMLLAFVSILGFVLEDNPTLRADVVDSALARIPVLGSELSGEVQPLTGSGIALVIGLGGALWAGLGVTVALGRAFAEIADVPRLEQPRGLKARARGLALLAILGVLLIGSTAATGLAVGGGITASAERVAAVAGSMIVNGLALLTAFALLSTRPRRVRDLLPGVALATVGTLVLQALGGWYVDHAIGLRDVRHRHRPALVVPARLASAPRGGGGERRPALASLAARAGRRARAGRPAGVRALCRVHTHGRARADRGRLPRAPRGERLLIRSSGRGIIGRAVRAAAGWPGSLYLTTRHFAGCT
jgi:uncharacterized BrkB/YihY/UPF0761 family membrane protein